MIIDTKLRGWIRTICWVLRPLKPFGYGKIYNGQMYIALFTPAFKDFYQNLRYVKRRTKHCIICKVLVPTWQSGSTEGSDGQRCAQCERIGNEKK